MRRSGFASQEDAAKPASAFSSPSALPDQAAQSTAKGQNRNAEIHPGPVGAPRPLAE